MTAGSIVKKIDMHAHTVRTLGIPRPGNSHFATAEQLLAMYDRLGVEKAVLLPNISPDCSYELNTNEEIFEITQRYPDRFVFSCNLDPRMGCNNGDTDFTYYLDHYAALGAKNVGELCANLYFDDPRTLALFKACEARNMPVTFHIGTAAGEYGLIDDYGLPRLEKCLQMFPGLRFLGHSQRWWSHISGDVTAETYHGYPNGPVRPGGRVVELMRKYPNMCGDLSAGSGFNAISRDPEFGYAFLEEFQDRLFFALDLCDPENIKQHHRIGLIAFLDEAMLNGKISYEAYYKISRGNAEKLLGL